MSVQLFAMLRERAGRHEWHADVPTGSTVAEVWRALVAVHPGLASFSGAVSCAVNADFAPMHAEVHDGDDVAFLPPVSGGSDGTNRA